MLTRSDRLHETAIVENSTMKPDSWLSSIHRSTAQNRRRTAYGVSRTEYEFLKQFLRIEPRHEDVFLAQRTPDTLRHATTTKSEKTQVAAGTQRSRRSTGVANRAGGPVVGGHL